MADGCFESSRGRACKMQDFTFVTLLNLNASIRTRQLASYTPDPGEVQDARGLCHIHSNLSVLTSASNLSNSSFVTLGSVDQNFKTKKPFEVVT